MSVAAPQETPLCSQNMHPAPYAPPASTAVARPDLRGQPLTPPFAIGGEEKEGDTGPGNSPLLSYSTFGSLKFRLLAQHCRFSTPRESPQQRQPWEEEKRSALWASSELRLIEKKGPLARLHAEGLACLLLLKTESLRRGSWRLLLPPSACPFALTRHLVGLRVNGVTRDLPAQERRRTWKRSKGRDRSSQPCLQERPETRITELGRGARHPGQEGLADTQKVRRKQLQFPECVRLPGASERLQVWPPCLKHRHPPAGLATSQSALSSYLFLPHFPTERVWLLSALPAPHPWASSLAAVTRATVTTGLSPIADGAPGRVMLRLPRPLARGPAQNGS
nr:uncharacterized protein LOC129531468 [Gorilla gorilla gorilla]